MKDQIGDSHEMDVLTCPHCGGQPNWRVKDYAEPKTKKCNHCNKKTIVWGYMVYVMRPINEKTR